jgi:hypothetical protein
VTEAISPQNELRAAPAMPDLGVAHCTPEMLYDLIAGMNRRRATGVLEVASSSGVKKLYFKAGEFVFASSDLMDDRLGEVIYRDAMITLDQLTQFAVQVDRKTKFGQVLLRSGNFTNTDLWNALKSQMREIFRSVFFVASSQIRVTTGKAPIEVSYESGTEELLDAGYSFGLQFRSFKERVSGDVRLAIVGSLAGQPASAGTFIADILEICKDSPVISDVVKRSKLSPLNTLVAIHRLIANGVLRAQGIPELPVEKVEGRFAGIKGHIDTFQLLRSIVNVAFDAAKIPFPVEDLCHFALSLNHDGGAAIFLAPNGDLDHESIAGILRQCAGNLNRMDYFQFRLVSLTRYLFQIASDTLPYEQAQGFKRDFQEIAH